MFTSQISRDEVRSAIEDKLCAHFAVTAKTATDDQVFQASAIVIREIMSRLLAVEETRCPDREVHYLSMEFLMGRSLMKNAFNLGIANALTGALEDLGRNASDIFEAENDAGLGNGASAGSRPAIWIRWPRSASRQRATRCATNWAFSARR